MPVDLTLVRQADGMIAPAAASTGVRISGGSNGETVTQLASVGSGDDQVAMGWQGSLPEPVLDGPKATYADVKPGIDLVVEATPGGVESLYIVQDREAADQVAQLAVPIAGQTVDTHRLRKDGQLSLLDDDQHEIAASPAPLMWDADTEPVTVTQPRRSGCHRWSLLGRRPTPRPALTRSTVRGST